MSDFNIKYLHIACYIYQVITNYDESYKNIISLSCKSKINSADTKLLIEWLRDWGCRQFEIKSEELSIKNILTWVHENEKSLPDINMKLLDYDINNIENLFNSLSNILVSKKRMGPVGAAKTLFALRPNVFAPWDNPIINALGFNGKGKDYQLYISDIKEKIDLLKKECKTKGIMIDNLPNYVGRNNSSLPKLLDEYYWITITNKFNPKSICEIVNKS